MVASLAPRHPERPGLLASLGNALRIIVEMSDDTVAMRRAVAVGRESVAHAPRGHPDRASALHNLALTLTAVFDRTGDIGVIDEAMAASQEAVAIAAADDTSGRATCMPWAARC